MAEYVSLVHGVDSLKLVSEINKQAKKHDNIVNCLLQMHIAEEETKFGLDEAELQDILNTIQKEEASFKNVCIVGLMGMATFTDDKNQVKKEFQNLKTIFEKYKTIQKSNIQMEILSMGMSGDYQIAMDCGTTMIRIGSSIFGSRK